MSWRARLSRSLHELRIVYCANSQQSQGTREFVKQNYMDIKILNPGLPIYIRPSEGVKPHVAARYDRGVYEMRSTAGMSADEVLNVVMHLESLAPEVNGRTSGGIGGDKVKFANIV